jgi:hypothetical protein
MHQAGTAARDRLSQDREPNSCEAIAVMRGLMLVAALLSFASIAHAGDTIVFGDSGATATHDCAAQPKVAITGAHNTITLTGACAKVAINGTGNRVTIASAALLAVTGSTNVVVVDTTAKIAVSGTQNKVSWKSGKKPRQSATGIGNTITKTPEPPPAP